MIISSRCDVLILLDEKNMNLKSSHGSIIGSELVCIDERMMMKPAFDCAVELGSDAVELGYEGMVV